MYIQNTKLKNHILKLLNNASHDSNESHNSNACYELNESHNLKVVCYDTNKSHDSNECHNLNSRFEFMI